MQVDVQLDQEKDGQKNSWRKFELSYNDKLKYMKKSHLRGNNCAIQLMTRFLTALEPESPLPYSQQPITRPHPKPDATNK
jgi:hypothetical protein